MSAILGKDLLGALGAASMLFFRFGIATTVLWVGLLLWRRHGGPDVFDVPRLKAFGVGILFGYMTITGFLALRYLDATRLRRQHGARRHENATGSIVVSRPLRAVVEAQATSKALGIIAQVFHSQGIVGPDLYAQRIAYRWRCRVITDNRLRTVDGSHMSATPQVVVGDVDFVLGHGLDQITQTISRVLCVFAVWETINQLFEGVKGIARSFGVALGGILATDEIEQTFLVIEVRQSAQVIHVVDVRMVRMQLDEPVCRRDRGGVCLMRVAYWPGCVSRGFTPELHGSMAKAQAAECALLAAKATLQCHGAIGYSYEHDLHLWMKRAWALACTWGDAAWHRERVAKAILDGRD